MKENKIQSSIVLWFSQNRPQDSGCLFAINNNSTSARSGVNNKAMGVYAGVSDLILFKKGVMVGCEIKSSDELHDKNHVINQLKWGVTIEENGGKYFVFTSKDEFIDFITEGTHPKYDIKEFQKLINNSKSKVKFI